MNNLTRAERRTIKPVYSQEVLTRVLGRSIVKGMNMKPKIKKMTVMDAADVIVCLLGGEKMW